jgi:crossover junction endodeoxyribonuclease RusA
VVIKLPVPPIELSPNGRCHWSRKQRLTRSAKARASFETLQALNGGPKPCPVGYSLHYYWKSTQRDDDNAIASAKAYLDGICSVLGIDDKNVRFRQLTHSRDSKRPRLEITLHA